MSPCFLSEPTSAPPLLHYLPTSRTSLPQPSLLDPAPESQAALEPLVSPPSKQSSLQRWEPRPPRHRGSPENNGHRPRARKGLQATPGKARSPSQTLITPAEPSQARSRLPLPAALASARRGEQQISALRQFPKRPPALPLPPPPPWGRCGATAAQEGPFPRFCSHSDGFPDWGEQWAVPWPGGQRGGSASLPHPHPADVPRVHIALSILLYDGQRCPPKRSGFPALLRCELSPAWGLPAQLGQERRVKEDLETRPPAERLDEINIQRAG